MYDFVDRPVTSLDHGGRFLIWSMRSWVEALNKRQCPPHVLAKVFARYNMIVALGHFHMVMMLLSRDSLETLSFGPLPCNMVTESEAVLLSLFRAARDEPVDQLNETLGMVVADDSSSSLFAALTAMSQQLSIANLIPEKPVCRTTTIKVDEK